MLVHVAGNICTVYRQKHSNKRERIWGFRLCACKGVNFRLVKYNAFLDSRGMDEFISLQYSLLKPYASWCAPEGNINFTALGLYFSIGSYLAMVSFLPAST